MTAKSTTDFQTENSELTQKLNMLTNNFKINSEEHKTLLKLLIEKSKNRCNNFDNNSEKGRNLKKNMNDKISTIGL